MNNEPLDLNWHNAAELVPPPFRLAEPVDEDYLEAHARQQQRDAFTYGFERKDRCGRCAHPWHGLACTTTGSSLCGCASSFEEAS